MKRLGFSFDWNREFSTTDEIINKFFLVDEGLSSDNTNTWLIDERLAYHFENINSDKEYIYFSVYKDEKYIKYKYSKERNAISY